MSTARSVEIALFPLDTVLFPGGRLPLRVFEPRYLAMTRECLRDQAPFGVCLIAEGREVGSPAMPAEVGCLARIETWETVQPGLIQLVARGEQRFRLLSTRVREDGLLLGQALPLEAEPPQAVATRHAPCVDLLRRLVDRFGETHFPPPHAFDDASWVGHRLAEVLPLDRLERQRLLVSNDALARLDRLVGQAGRF